MTDETPKTTQSLGSVDGMRTALPTKASSSDDPSHVDSELGRFFSLSLELLCIANFDGYFTRLNPSWERTLGWTIDELMSRPFIEFVHPDDREATQAEAARIATGQDTVTFENRYRGKDGSYRWLMWTATSYVDEGLIYATAREFSQRKKVEDALNERLRLAALDAEVATVLTRKDALPEILNACAESLVRHLEAAFARVWTIDSHGTTLELRASAGLYTHLDGDHSRVPVGQFKIGMIAAERKPHLTNQVIGDERVHHQDWAQREGMVAFAGYPLIVDDQVVGVVALFARHELSESVLQTLGNVALNIATCIRRKAAEAQLIEAHDQLDVRVKTRTAELAASEEKFAKAFRSSPDAIMLTSTKDGMLVDVNETACSMSGFSRDELIGESTLDLSLWANVSDRDQYVKQ